MQESALDKAIFIADKGLSFAIVRKARILPPLGILNSFLQCGIDDILSDVSLHWEPFCLTEWEYNQFVEYCKASMGGLDVDDLGTHDYCSWFSKAALKDSP